MIIKEKLIRIELWETELNKWYESLVELKSENIIVFSETDNRSKAILQQWDFIEDDTDVRIGSITKEDYNVFSIQILNDEIKIFRTSLPTEDELKKSYKED